MRRKFERQATFWVIACLTAICITGLAKPIPGKRRPAQATKSTNAIAVSPGTADYQRGYYVAALEGKALGKPVNKLLLTLGQSDRESIPLLLFVMKRVGAVRCEISPFVAKDGHETSCDCVRIFEERAVRVPTGDKAKSLTRRNELLPASILASSPNGADAKVIWVTVDTTGLGPDGYCARLTFSPQEAEPLVIPIYLRVLPIRLGELRPMATSVRHNLFALPGCKPGPSQQGRIHSPYLEDLGRHWVDTVESRGWGGKEILGLVRQRGSQDSIWDMLQANPLRFHYLPLPEPDFSALDSWFESTREHGMKRLAAVVEISPKPSLWQRFYWRQIARYLVSKGFDSQDLWVVVPQGKASALDAARTAHWLKEAGWQSVIRFRAGAAAKKPQPSCSGLGYGYQRQWGWLSAYQRQPRAVSEVPYIDTRSAHGLATDSASGPASSPAWEGLADGFADGEYLALLLQEMDKLIQKKRERTATAAELGCLSSAQTTLARIIGRHPKAILGVSETGEDLGFKPPKNSQHYGFDLEAYRYREAKRKLLQLLVKLRQSSRLATDH